MRLLIVPAAGRGSRLRSPLPKALVPVNGRPMLDHLARLYGHFVERIVVVAHPSSAAAIRAWGERQERPVDVVIQPEPTGMLDAILCAAPVIARVQPAWIWITWCDQVGVLPETVARLEQETAVSSRALILPTVRQRNPYIHLARDGQGRVARVLHRREGDQMPDEGESDMGVFALTRETYEQDLVRYARDASVGGGTGERNFLPFIPWLATRADVVTFPCTNPMEALGVNTPEDLQVMEAWLRESPR